jgi:septum formation protein
MLVLASASERRRELLARLGVQFEVVTSGADESAPPGTAPDEVARVIARRKAMSVAPTRDEPVLAADTIVVSADGEILGKPADAADARRILAKLSGTTHCVVTGVCLATGRGARLATESCSTSVTMRPLGDDEIAAYVATGECFDKAGAYAIQETADRFVTRVDGSFTNVVGLPLELVSRMLAAEGIGTRAWA